jgi:methylphosphotriester-DNA--protein-cysteine methyltransferase
MTKQDNNPPSVPDSKPPESGGEHSMDLNFSVNDLNVSLKTQQSLSAETCALAGQVNLLRQHLAETVQKLEEANYKVGFLQAQLLMQQKHRRVLKISGSKRIRRIVRSESQETRSVEIIEEP